MSHVEPGPSLVTDVSGSQHDVIDIVREFIRELHGQRAKTSRSRRSSRLDRDLGIDSLGRTELILRLEHAFGVLPPAAIVAEVETVEDLLRAWNRRLRPRRLAPAERKPRRPPLPLVPPRPRRARLPEVLDWHVAQHRDRMHVTVAGRRATMLETMTYAQLAQAARAGGGRADRARRGRRATASP